MKIEHVALWVRDLENMRRFFCTYFEGTSNEKYRNERKQFESYFISFPDGARLELMQRPDITLALQPGQEAFGYTHLAFTAGSISAVNALTERLRADGLQVVGEPRTTGDGYYESVILDPEGNRIEITA